MNHTTFTTQKFIISLALITSFYNAHAAEYGYNEEVTSSITSPKATPTNHLDITRQQLALVNKQANDYYNELRQQIIAQESQYTPTMHQNAHAGNQSPRQMNFTPQNSMHFYMHSPFANIQSAYYTQQQLGFDVSRAIAEPSHGTRKQKIKSLTSFIQDNKTFIQQNITSNNLRAVGLAMHINQQKNIVQSAAALHTSAENQEFSIKEHDPLVNDNSMLQAAGISVADPSLLFLQHQQKFLTQPLSTPQKWKIFNEIKFEFIDRYEKMSKLDRNRFKISHPTELTDLDDLTNKLPAIYEIDWNLHKFRMTWQLLNNADDAQEQLDAQMQQQEQFDAMHIQLRRNNSEYDHALSLLHATTIHHESIITQRWQTLCDKALTAMQQKEALDAQTAKAYQLVRNYAVSWKINKEKIAQEKIVAELAEKRKQSEQAKALRKSCDAKATTDKANLLQQQQELAEQKRIEQSKADKEHHRAELQLQLEKQEADAKIVADKINLLRKQKEAAKEQKKAERASLAKQEIDAQAQHNNAANLTGEQDLGTACATADQSIPTVYQNSNNSLFNIMQDDEPEEAIFQCTELQRFTIFSAIRKDKLAHLQTLKEADEQENLKKVMKAKACDRALLKEQLAAKTHKKYIHFYNNEKFIMDLLTEYQERTTLASVNTTTFKQIKSLKNHLVATQELLKAEGLSLSWYLVLNPELYKKIKDQYLQLKTLINFIDASKIKRRNNEILQLLADPSKLCSLEESRLHNELKVLMPIHKKSAILEILDSLHTINGLLDITHLTFTPLTYADINRMGILKDQSLQDLTKSINNLYVNGAVTLQCDAMIPIICNALQQAGIAPITDLVNDIINMSAKLATNNSETDFEKMTIAFFMSFQRANEMACPAYTQDQMADMIKIHICAWKTLQEILNR